MPAAARANGADQVFSKTGNTNSKNCGFPVQTITGPGTCQVYVNRSIAVRGDDLVGSHSFSGCGPDTSTMTEGSGTVFIGGKKMARIGDNYGSDNIIISGSTTVFVGG